MTYSNDLLHLTYSNVTSLNLGLIAPIAAGDCHFNYKQLHETSIEMKPPRKEEKRQSNKYLINLSYTWNYLEIMA
jgi:hypothetical protein